MDRHHEEFVFVLRECQVEAGGPVSLSQFLRLSESPIRKMRDNRVGWDWIAARVLAVHQTTPETQVPEDIPDARRRSSRLVSSLWSRVAVKPVSQIEASSITNQTIRDFPVESAASASSCQNSAAATSSSGPLLRVPSTLRSILQDHDTIDQLGRF